MTSFWDHLYQYAQEHLVVRYLQEEPTGYGRLSIQTDARRRGLEDLAGWTVPERGWWYLLDRQEDREGSMFQRSSFNYTLAVYDTAAATLSYLEFDT